MQISLEKRFFLIFFPFSKFKVNLEHFQKKMMLIADAFFNSQIPANVVR